MKEHVKILLVGDEGVGKSSLISAYISQHFPQEVPPVMTDAIIPPEATANEVCVTIMDSSAHTNDRDVLRQKIVVSDSILILFDVTRPETFDSVENFWLPLITDLSTDQYKPVILVGTKTDLLMEDPDMERLRSLFSAYPSLLNYYTCSAVNIDNIDTVFHLAELFVNFPLSVLRDMETGELLPAARRAFLRIFRIFDMDGDNLLCDKELSETQLHCFEDQINTDELTYLKRHISTNVPGGLHDNSVTFEGFLGIINSSLEQHQYQVPWLILRKFNYDDNLNIVVSTKFIIFDCL
jgi:Ras family protein T1